MVIREIQKSDAANFLNMLIRLDCETKNMMYEPEERPKDVTSMEDRIGGINSTQSLLLVADNDGEIVGFISAERGSFHRIKHTAYIVVGVLPEFQGKGIGSEFFSRMEEWARQSEILRLELTVMTHNNGAIRLYKKYGFEIEGIKRHSMIVDDLFVDEYYMGKLL